MRRECALSTYSLPGPGLSPALLLRPFSAIPKPQQRAGSGRHVEPEPGCHLTFCNLGTCLLPLVWALPLLSHPPGGGGMCPPCQGPAGGKEHERSSVLRQTSRCARASRGHAPPPPPVSFWGKERSGDTAPFPPFPSPLTRLLLGQLFVQGKSGLLLLNEHSVDHHHLR